MERLTKRSGEMVWYNGEFKGKRLLFEPCEVMIDCGAEDIKKMLRRLAAYEDTGLEPEAFDQHAKMLRGINILRFHEILQAETEGRLIILPARTVFCLQWDAGADCNLQCPEDDSGEERCDLCYFGELCIYERQMRQEHLDQIGETVFYGRGDAENKRHEILKAMAHDRLYD